jgi:sugar/nucleoside kinase (ribokinase family)
LNQEIIAYLKIMNVIRINATGCALMDYIYPDMSFNSPAFKKYLSLKEGDGGLSPGKLVFAEEIEKFSGIEIHQIINNISGSVTPVSSNIGGPAIVAIIHAAQLMGPNSEINFYGAIGKDSIAKEFLKLIEKTPVSSKYLTETEGITAFTDVLVDPSYQGGHGERCFINNIGAAGNYSPELISDQFFDADIVVFGGTALVPQIHDNLNNLLKKAKTRDCFTVVNTVYDFRNEKKNPGKPWPLADCSNIDLLIMDFEEALRISGKSKAEDASNYFISTGVRGFIITNGSSDTLLFSKEDKTMAKKTFSFPVSNKVKELIKNGIYKGDTTGCGDNFCGGVIFSLASQIQKNKNAYPDLKDAIIWGTASGGFACSYKGGCYFEKQKGEKLKALDEIISAYKIQEGMA